MFIVHLRMISLLVCGDALACCWAVVWRLLVSMAADWRWFVPMVVACDFDYALDVSIAFDVRIYSAFAGAIAFAFAVALDVALVPSAALDTVSPCS